MPLYEYACRDCGHEFELLVFPGDEAACPQCQGKDLEKQWSVPAAPPAASTPLPVGGCGDPTRPPCGPACARWPGKG
jgi:putative FmdB family regulatory protein